MRILYITGGFPFPLTSGFLRHYHLIKSLSQTHQIVLLCMVSRSFEPEHRKAIEPFTEQIHTFAPHTSKSRSLMQKVTKRIRVLFGVEPTLMEMRKTIQQLLAESTFDVVLLSGEYTYHAIKGLDTPPIISDMCDAKSMRAKTRMKIASPLKMPILWIKYFEMRRIEKRVLASIPTVLFVSVRDAAIVPPHQRDKIEILPNGVDLDFWQRSSDKLKEKTIIFTGAMHYPPNHDAAMYLIQDILPLVRKAVPDVKVLIVGHSPKPELVEAASEAGVTVTGFVDDMRVYLEDATVYAASLRFGSGIQNKVLEALAMEVPVVSTPQAADGLVTATGKAPPMQIVDTTQAFAEAIIDQLAFHGKTLEPFHEGRQFVEENFSWESSTAKLSKLIERVGQKRA